MSLKINLQNHTALITGATGQLGRVMVETMAQAGADIIIHYKNNHQKASQLQASLLQKNTKSFIVSGDITCQEDINRIKEEIQSSFTMPDIIVTNAVTQIFPWKPLLDEEPQDYENQFKSCVMQNVYMAKAFIPAMTPNKWGRFIGINTECSIQTLETQSAYVSGKRGMDGVFRVLSKEVGPLGITVNQVAPGWTISYKDRQKNTEDQPEYTKNVPLRRRGTDQEVANVVAFLASDLSSFITGAFIPVNGGNALTAI